ncbi:hypothetical protein ACA29_05815 [Lederbergia galactosidilytica]|uniref:Uncharacterized protein n=1 Tax=Lederbergia galactosidilytica TaxID=217031 RepID=A0A0Q9Y0V0_9BACI|nr:hypothetical protein ACA29_05815 [Lederbergia galactosidilytica]
MDIEQLRQWMEMAQKYQNGNFWDTFFDQYMGANHQNTLVQPTIILAQLNEVIRETKGNLKQLMFLLNSL